MRATELVSKRVRHRLALLIEHLRFAEISHLALDGALPPQHVGQRLGEPERHEQAHRFLAQRKRAPGIGTARQLACLRAQLARASEGSGAATDRCSWNRRRRRHGPLR